MIRSSSAPRGVAAAAIAVLALTVGLLAAAPAQADNSDNGPGCGLVCGLLPGDQKSPPDPPGNGKPTGSPSPTPTAITPPSEQNPTVPAVPVAPAPAVAPPAAPEPAVSPDAETPTPEAATSTVSPSAASVSPSAVPSAESNWDTPVTRTAKTTQAAAVSRNDGSGLFGGPGLLPIMAGVLLVGAAGLAFAWWGRNRFASH
ncbi:hypothetical protein [Pseudarthrobacter sulfonivorans]|uniref:hypothetical protein n=1 Tax=Pseudarthrobacter sulfonivorans TaxID=121292 RepID=UPI002104FE09|nr:hypothetical protein [Pseudarthrobacter sulfonivorans]